jgi:hypothetical protein
MKSQISTEVKGQPGKKCLAPSFFVQFPIHKIFSPEGMFSIFVPTTNVKSPILSNSPLALALFRPTYKLPVHPEQGPPFDDLNFRE